jgi:hypothetical protein
MVHGRGDREEGSYFIPEGGGDFSVDVAVESDTEVSDVWDHPSIVQLNATLEECATIVRAIIDRPALAVQVCWIIIVWDREPFGARAIWVATMHTGRIGGVWAMEVVGRDDPVQLRLSNGVRNVSTDNVCKVGRCA